MERSYETITRVEDSQDGETVTIHSILNTTYPECPIVLVPLDAKKMNDFKINDYMGCIPYKYMKHKPKDQSGAILQKCTYCDNKMWVSDLKRRYEKEFGKKLICFLCFFSIIKANGINPNDIELFDLTRLH